jgi:hypothetical protein
MARRSAAIGGGPDGVPAEAGQQRREVTVQPDAACGELFPRLQTRPTNQARLTRHV